MSTKTPRESHAPDQTKKSGEIAKSMTEFEYDLGNFAGGGAYLSKVRALNEFRCSDKIR